MKCTKSVRLISFCVLSGMLLGGCAATQIALSKKDLAVNSKMSDTIFLNPVSDEQRTIYVQVKNTSDQPAFSVSDSVKTLLAGKGFRVVSSLNKAHYLLQANILQVGVADPSAAEKMMSSGFGGSMPAGMLMGAGVGYFAGGHSGNGAIGGALIAGAAETIADSLVKDVTFSAITDVRISERVAAGEVVKQKMESTLNQGSQGTVTQTSSTRADWTRYQTRILSTAEKVNLKFEEARPALENGLSSAIAGIF